MNIEYKRLTEKELDTIIKMRIDQLTEEYTSAGKTVPEDVDLEQALMDFYKKNMAAGTYVSWLAFDGDRIVGTSGMSFAEKPPYFTCPSGKLGILSSMYTDPEYRRMGIATALLDKVVKEAKDYGCGTIYITASDMGVKLYESYGFQHNGNFLQYYF
ncbi:MAG: GNAT family N-acetyltransferase [Lachnospiraceae bacterium]|nr:GNAT family N-acetyltransferase [Lachnospiraceae bacterium]